MAGDDPVGQDAGDQATGAAETSATMTPEDTAAEIVQLKDQLRDQVLRAQAEAENVRRRAARDVENAHKFATFDLIGALVPVVDNLERAVTAARAATQSSSAGHEANAIAEGIELSVRLFTDTLARFGVEPVDPVGQPFDPNLHQAMSMVENPDMEPNAVMQVLQKGYALKGRLLRPAMVIVARPAAPSVDERA